MGVDLDSNGRLPPGMHRFTWEELVDQFGWNDARRRLLVGLKRALDDLRAAGCWTVFIDGSFVTDKETPADFDGCWDRTGVDLRRLLDTPLWTFDEAAPLRRRRTAANSSRRTRKPMRLVGGFSTSSRSIGQPANARASSFWTWGACRDHQRTRIQHYEARDAGI